MGYYKGPTEMKEERAKQTKKNADKQWAKAKEAEKKGDKKAAGKHYGTAKKGYKRAEAAKKDAVATKKKYGNKTFSEIKAKKPVAAKKTVAKKPVKE